MSTLLLLGLLPQHYLYYVVVLQLVVRCYALLGSRIDSGYELIEEISMYYAGQFLCCGAFWHEICIWKDMTLA